MKSHSGIISIIYLITLMGCMAIITGCGGSGGSSGGTSFSSDTGAAATTPVSTPQPTSTVSPQPTASSSPQPTPTQNSNQPAWVSRSDGRKYHITENLLLSYDKGMNKVSAVLPVPKAMMYQDMGTASYYDSVNGIDSSVKITVSPDANCTQDYLHIAKTGDICARFLVEEPDSSATGERSYTFTLEYDITLYTVRIDFSKITTIYSYDQSSEIYTTNTGKDGDQGGYYLNPEHSTIQSVSDTFWAQAQGNYLQYAKLCYDWVSSPDNFTYGNPAIGLRYLDDIMESRVVLVQRKLEFFSS